MTQNKRRSVSIDAYRAVVMLLMIFVNDTWTLIDIPTWIGHLPAEQDGVGLADVVFPAFLFIVGLSVPFAIQSRIRKGDTKWAIVQHIILRAAALIVMGLFHVNLEYYPDNALLSKSVWQILITVGFFLVWLNYSDQNSKRTWLLKVSGIVLLMILVLLFKDKTAPFGTVVMQVYWWGILGIIGWSYLLVSIVFLVTKGKWWIQIVVFITFVLFNMGAQSALFDSWSEVRNYIWIIGDGAMPALAICGVCLSLLYRKWKDTDRMRFVYYGLFIGLALLLLGQWFREFWIISKIWATPSFTLICAGISTLGFVFVTYITDIRKWTSWYGWIQPAGTSTLTCYLLPYIHYALLGFVAYRLPEWMRTGELGMLKSLIYAWIIIVIAGWLERRRLNLKL